MKNCQKNSLYLALEICGLIAFSGVFLLSCSSAGSKKSLNFSIKNNSPAILTVTLKDERSIRIIEGFCFKFADEDFPLTVVFNNYESSLLLSEPAHYLIEGPKRARKAPEACQPAHIE